MANARLQTLVYGSVLALIAGWVLYIGKAVFVPIVLSIFVVYVMVGLTRLLGGIPYLGRLLPMPLRYALSVMVSVLVLIAIAYVALANFDKVMARAPQYQASLLSTIQALAIHFGIEDEPTWATLRQSFLDQVSIQGLIGSTVSSATSIVTSAIVVGLYVVFLLVEQHVFAAKIDNLSKEPRNVALIRQLITNINARVGSYLALKTFLSFLLGVISWIIMARFGLEFAAFWAMLIFLLNYVPYIGSFLSVFLPVMLAIVQFADANTVMALLLSLSAVQFLIGNFLDPYLLGNTLNLSPFVILVSLTVWSGLWGIPGAFLAVPITAIMVIVFSEFAGTRPIAILLSRNGQL